MALPRSRFHISSPLLVLLAVAGLLFFAARPIAAVAKGGPPDVRVAGVCGAGGAASSLRLRSRGGIEVRFEVDQRRAGEVWRVVLVHERRVAWKGSAKTGLGGSFEVERTVADLPGADEVTVRAWGPGGLGCSAVATVFGS
jgi:hypothetical protein